MVFNGHVEVVSKYADGVLSTIGGDSLPNFSVNAHAYLGPLASQGVVGFVNNGTLPAVADKVVAGGNAAPAGQQAKKKVEGTQHQAASSRPAAPAGLPVAAAPAMAAGPPRHRRHHRHPRLADHGPPAVAQPDGTFGRALQAAQPGARPRASA